MGSEVIAKQKRIPLVGAPLNPHVGIGAALAGRRAEEKLAPIGGRIGEGGRTMVPPDALGQGVAGALHGGHHVVVQRCYRDLDIDDVFGIQPRHGS